VPIEVAYAFQSLTTRTPFLVYESHAGFRLIRISDFEMAGLARKAGYLALKG
jgi:hypothetical protein